MDLFFEIAGDQIDGARDYQEDAFLTTYIDDADGESKASALVIMADGMGGHAAGNIASNLVVSTFNKSFTGKFGTEDVPHILRESLLKANDALRESIRETPALDGMGCTMVTAAVTKGKVYWVSVGDSHLYVVRDRKLEKKNDDHSYGGYLDRMKAKGMDIEAEAGLSRNMLMSAMTGDDLTEIDCPDAGFQLLPRDRLIIASDGLDTLNESTIIQTSAWSPTPKECVQALLTAVEDAKKPRQDNTTVIVIDVMQRAAMSAPTPVAPTVDVAAERSAAAPPAVAPASAPLEEVHEYEDEEAPGTNWLAVGLAVLVLLSAAGAAGYYFMFMKPESVPGATVPTPATTGGQGAGTGSGTGAQTPTQTNNGQVASGADGSETQQPTGQSETPAGGTPDAATTEPPADAGREFRDSLKSGGKGPLMVEIPGGSFQMGSGGQSVKSEERPRHPVTVGAFAMSKFEITIAEYERFAKATGRKLPKKVPFDKDRFPAIYVSWDDAYGYARWLSAQTGERYRLPSEAEWEYAASGAKSTPFWWGFNPGSNRAHCFDCDTGLKSRQPTRIGRFDPNPFGLHDSAGNVHEWVHDCYHADYQGAPDDGSVWEGGDCTHHVARGGAYSSVAESIRSATRAKFKTQGEYDSVGIRLLREL